MQIVPAKACHVPRILELLVQVNNVHSDGRPDLFLRDRTKYREEELLALLGDPEKPIFVAVEDGNVLGYAFGQLQSHAADYNWPDIVTFYVDDICVDEACRGRHIGTALYEFVKAYAREQGCYNLTLNVWEQNPAAKAFYASLGLFVQKTGLETIL